MEKHHLPDRSTFGQQKHHFYSYAMFIKKVQYVSRETGVRPQFLIT